MAASLRLVSTGELDTPLCEKDLQHPLEKFLWLYLKQCDASTISGLYPLSLGKTAYQTGIPLQDIIEILGKLERLTVKVRGKDMPAIVHDDGLLFIPSLTDSIKVSNNALSHHVESVRKAYTGSETNRAWQAFLKQFFASEKKIVRGKSGQFAGKAKATAPAPAPGSRTVASITMERGPREAQHSDDASFPDVLEYFATFRTAGRGLACPAPIEDHADGFFNWVIQNPRDDWRHSAGKWIENLLIKDHKEIAQYESGLVLTDTGVLFKL